jgi:hypothetical protein
MRFEAMAAAAACVVAMPASAATYDVNAVIPAYVERIPEGGTPTIYTAPLDRTVTVQAGDILNLNITFGRTLYSPKFPQISFGASPVPFGSNLLVALMSERIIDYVGPELIEFPYGPDGAIYRQLAASFQGAPAKPLRAEAVSFSGLYAQFRIISITDRQSGVPLSATLTNASANLSFVPEPATWALMILGFGAVGAALRRRVRSIVPMS